MHPDQTSLFIGKRGLLISIRKGHLFILGRGLISNYLTQNKYNFDDDYD